MERVPGGLASVVQLHTLSVDLAATLMAPESDGPASLHTASLPSYAGWRRQASSVAADVLRDEPVRSLPAPDTKRRARQAALRSARAAREDQYAPRVAPVVSIADLSSSSSDDDPLARKTPSVSTDSSSEYGLAGPLRKRGRKTKIQMRRHFMLVGSTLYSYRSKFDERASWKLRLAGADVLTDDVKFRILLRFSGDRKLVLFARNARETDTWGLALARAADAATADSATAFLRNDSPTCVRRFERWSGERECKLEQQAQTGTGVVDMTRMVKESGEWDSFRSFSALRMRTTWKQDE